MPSPFPGMDPWLEGSPYWRAFHHSFMAHLCSHLNVTLPDTYVATLNQRWIADDEAIHPDVLVQGESAEVPNEDISPRHSQTEADPCWEVDAGVEPIRQAYIEIVAANKPDKVITLIEVLIPGNKLGKSHGNEAYSRKQWNILQGATHLLEIDLLRSGIHTVSPPFHLLSRKGRWDYLVSVSRSWNRLHWQVWGVTLQHRLPRVLVPLQSDVSDVVLDLQACLDRVYDRGRFSQLIDYSKNPWPPLEEKDAIWANELLTEKGLRFA